ncbi:MAG: type IV pili twitching motility protein PilT, partial [Planctomycetaceae bacterium]|nr:type IV pili twitching motility protein PilT [Planctomycetaceae bacterium]
MAFTRADFYQLLERMVEQGASDLHLSSDEYPFLRCDGALVRQDDAYSTAMELEEVAVELMNDSQAEVFRENRHVDMALSAGRDDRFRVNVYRDRGNVSFAIRLLDKEFRTLEELNLPAQLDSFSEMKDGLVLV